MVHSKATLALSLASYHMLHIFHRLSPVPEELLSFQSRATPLNSHRLLSGGVGVTPRVHPPPPSCQSALLGQWVLKKGMFKGPSLLHALLCTQASPASVMAGAAHWHSPNSRRVPLSPTAPPCLLMRQTDRLN